MAVPIDPAAADLAALEDPAPPAAPVPAAVDSALPAPPAPNVQPAGAVAGQHEQFNEVFLEFCAFFLFLSFSLIACFSFVSFCFLSREGFLMFTTCWLLFNIHSCFGHIFGLPCVGSS